MEQIFIPLSIPIDLLNEATRYAGNQGIQALILKAIQFHINDLKNCDFLADFALYYSEAIGIDLNSEKSN